MKPPIRIGEKPSSKPLTGDLVSETRTTVPTGPGGYGLAMPELRAVKEGTFAAWQKRRGKLGGQHKVPRIITDGELLQNLRDFIEDRTV